jgi:branched-chain amino acid transport system ATP-binding protein
VTDAVLIIDKLVVAFEALKAVDGVSISIPRGERRAIIGPNGAGKTTLFNAATGLVRPTHGRIVFDGRDITRLPPHRRARLGISRTFQITNLFPTLSVSDNMALAVRGLEPQKLSLFGSPQLRSGSRIASTRR